MSAPMYGIENLPWESRRDAETLAEANAIKNDPERLRNARKALELSQAATDAALKGTPLPPTGRHHANPATIQRLNVKY